MERPVWCEIVCVGCASRTHGEWTLSNRVPLKRLLANARSAGFSYSDDRRDWLCAVCVKRMRQQQLSASEPKSLDAERTTVEPSQ
jgi:hypothetical protein